MISVEPNWNQVVSDLSPGLYKYFQSRVSKTLSDDLTQECLLRLYRKYTDGDFNASKGSLRMFAYGIARFVLLEALKTKNHEELESDLISDDSSLESDLLKKQIAFNLRKGIQQLSPIQQECLCLMMDEQLSMEQIAIIAGIPINTVKSHIFRSKEQLKVHLSPMMEDT